jgi:nucleotide-binding universal stress UspA family protein
MSTIKNVLVAIDFSDGSRDAVHYAADLAQRLGARLTALHVTPPYVTYDPLPAFPVPAPLDPEAQRRVEGALRRFVTPPGSEHAPAEIVVREGDPADEILAQAAGSEADLIVLGTHGHRGFERWILGSVTESVARKADHLVLAVPPGVRTAAVPRVLCALDLSESSAQTLEQAVSLARALSARLVVLYVADGTHWYEPWPIAGVDVEAVRQAVTKSARERLGELIGRHVPSSISADVQVAFGRAQREIERLVGEGACLVVLGASSSHGADRFFFGSTAQHVLRAGLGPVLLVRHAVVGAATSDVGKNAVALSS